jgi:S-adenosyl-L-methionine hydrolase (adenosine-forming)
VSARVTLLTDFGTRDGYVAAVKGVIAAIAPESIIDDAAHDIGFGDVREAAWALARYWRRYPPGTVHVCVVDPGVGSARRALALHAERRFFVGPDNGVFTHVLSDADFQAVSLENSTFHGGDISATFHGRDVFAPVAAHLARGVSLDELGPAVTDPVRFEVARPHREGGVVHGEVVHIDRFGNLITNIPAQLIADGARVGIDGHDLGTVRRTYADAARGDALALIGSDGMLEVAVRDGRMNGAVGTRVRVTQSD